MLIRKYHILFFLLVILSFSEIIAQRNFRWEKTFTGKNQPLKFIFGKEDNYWVQNLNGELFNIIEGNIKWYKLPDSIPINKAYYLYVSDNCFLYSGVNSDWEGGIYKFSDKGWNKFDIKFSAPTNVLVKDNNRIFVFGDDGAFFELKNDEWKEIQTPFNSHCVTAYSTPKGLFISTIREGAYIFNSGNFTKLKKSDKYSYIKTFREIKHNVYGITHNGKILVCDGDSLVEEQSTEIKKIFSINVSENFGFAEQWILFKDKILKIKFPQDYNIEEVHAFSDSSIILLSEDGYIYNGKPVNRIYFNNLASIYRVEDLPKSKNRGVQFFDGDNDGVDDLLIINYDIGNYLTFYKGIENSSFADVTSISNLPFKKYPIDFVNISDFNKDGLNDIVILVKKDDDRKILYYVNKGSFKFELEKEFRLPDDFQEYGINYFSTFDYDNDGDNDLVLTSYKSSSGENGKGYILFYKNNLFGRFGEIDTVLKSTTTKWNRFSVFADINNDNLNDIFVTTYWGQNYILMGKGNSFKKEKNGRLPEHHKTETKEAKFTDYDNDGDLDLFTVGTRDILRVYENDGDGFFNEITKGMFNYSHDEINKEIVYTRNLKFGDFNNDGFTDFFLTKVYSDTGYTAFYLNKQGKVFVKIDSVFENMSFPLLNAAVSDFDNDGDLDVYGTRNGHNMLWVNSLNRNNFLKIKLQGITSNTNAIGSKIWIYKHTNSNENGKLLGYKQTSSSSFGRISFDSFVQHFGLNDIAYCDIKVRFPSGKTIIKKNVKAGSYFVIEEEASIPAFFIRLPGNIYRFIRETDNQMYLIIILLSHLLILSGLNYGMRKLNWANKIVVLFGVLNISLFWIVLYVSSFSNNQQIKFLLPAVFTFVIITVPLLVSIWLLKLSHGEINESGNKLLELMMSFSHGGVALRNINSIILLCENLPANWKENEEYSTKLSQRFDTFKNITIGSIREIIKLEKLTNKTNLKINSLERAVNKIETSINQFEINKLLSEKFSDEVKFIRNGIKELRESVYKRNSCLPEDVVKSVLKNFETIIEKENIKISKVKEYSNNIAVLIKSYELSDILANLIQNSISFMKDSNKKEIQIRLIKESPKVVVLFSNTGSPIPANKWEKIFESGYSERKSSGIGLAVSRKVLAKYGGRIKVFSSDVDKTIFKIELNEGILK